MSETLSALDRALLSVGINPNEKVSRSKQLRKEAAGLQKEASKMIERIPAGQPVRSTGDRNLRDRSLEKARKAVELLKEAERLEGMGQ